MRAAQGKMTDDNSTEPHGVPGWARPLIGKNPTVTLIRAALLVGIIFGTYRFVLTPIKVYGVSMEPTFQQGKVLWLNRLAYRSRKPQRSDIVVIRMAGGSVTIIKRVIGLPGESIAIIRGQVHIDGEALDEPYIKERNASWNYGPKQVGDGRLFVIGDNRTTHMENQEFGFVAERNVMGRVNQ